MELYYCNLGSDNSKATSIVKWTRSAIGTGQILSHEIAHNLGVRHDFETYQGRSWTCGPEREEDGGDIMNYGIPKGSVWSRCSRRDFENYLNRVINKQSKFCLVEFSGIENSGLKSRFCNGETCLLIIKNAINS